LQVSSRTRNFVLIVLLSSVLTAIPSANSQEYTTSTSTLTSPLTLTKIYNFVSLTIATSTEAGTATFTQGYYSTVAGAPCKLVLLGTFNSTGATHFEYSVNGPTTLYILAGPLRIAVTELKTATTIVGCESIVSILGFPSYTRQISGSGSGSFDLNLPTAHNPYIYAMVVPVSQVYPSGRLAITPLWGTYTIAMSLTRTSTATFAFNTTITSLTPMELQPRGIWTVSLCIVVLIVLFAFYLLYRRKR